MSILVLTATRPRYDEAILGTWFICGFVVLGGFHIPNLTSSSSWNPQLKKTLKACEKAACSPFQILFTLLLTSHGYQISTSFSPTTFALGFSAILKVMGLTCMLVLWGSLGQEAVASEKVLSPSLVRLSLRLLLRGLRSLDRQCKCQLQDSKPKKALENILETSSVLLNLLNILDLQWICMLSPYPKNHKRSRLLKDDILICAACRSHALCGWTWQSSLDGVHFGQSRSPRQQYSRDMQRL